MAKTNLGRIVPIHKGVYSDEQTYALNHLVSYNGSLYWHSSKEETTGVSPDDKSIWILVTDMNDALKYVERAESAALKSESTKEDAESARDDAEASAKKAQEFADSIHTDLTEVTNEVSGLKESVSKVNNATEIPATAGKVWTSTENGAGWADPQGGGSGGAVSSVNGKTGAVELSAKDVRALPDTTEIPVVPEKVSAFENDAGYLTEHQDISGKVDKVEGKGLSTNDYDNSAKEKVDAIPEKPVYTDTVTLVDATLKNEGEAADAKATGDALNQLKNDLSDLAPEGAAVGQLFRVASISEDGKYTMEPVDMPSVGGVTDVNVEGTSIVQDGVACIPVANIKTISYGLVKTSENVGMVMHYGTLGINSATQTGINLRSPINSGGGRYGAVTPANMDYAVKASMCDGKGAAWTDTERIAALLRMGCTVDDNGFVKWGASE